MNNRMECIEINETSNPTQLKQEREVIVQLVDKAIHSEALLVSDCLKPSDDDYISQSISLVYHFFLFS